MLQWNPRLLVLLAVVALVALAGLAGYADSVVNGLTW
jgi:hypothetical protein